MREGKADELIEKASLNLGGHVGVAVLSSLACSNDDANIETKTIYIYDTLVRVAVTGAAAGQVTLGGTITTYGLDMLDGETVSYPVSSGVFLISKTVEEVSENKPYVDENANRTIQTGGISVRTHPFCHPKGSELCHAGTSSVKAKTLYFVKADHLICRGCKCSRENKSDKPIMRHA